MRIKCPMTNESICESDLVQFLINFTLNLEKQNIITEVYTEDILEYMNTWIKHQKELNGIKED